ncbi:phage tail protein [Desulfarculus baarsii]
MEFHVNTSDLDKVTEALLKYRGEIPKALVAAANRGAASVRTLLVREGRRVYNLDAASLRKTMPIKRANFNDGHYTAYVTAGQRGASLMRYEPDPADVADNTGVPNTERAPREGVSVQVLRQGARKIVRGAFVARFKSGHLAVVRRTGEPRRKSKASGMRTYPVAKLYGPASRAVLNNPRVREAVIPLGQEKIRKALHYQLEGRLAKRSGLK